MSLAINRFVSTYCATRAKLSRQSDFQLSTGNFYRSFAKNVEFEFLVLVNLICVKFLFTLDHSQFLLILFTHLLVYYITIFIYLFVCIYLFICCREIQPRAKVKLKKINNVNSNFIKNRKMAKFTLTFRHFELNAFFNANLKFTS